MTFKLQEARDQSINVTTKVRIPENMKFNSFDMTIILGNIIDNAIEAAVLNEEKRIDILLVYSRKRMLLKVKNTYSGTVNVEQGRLMTIKSDSDNHGIGLQNVTCAVKKYNGTIDITFDDMWFGICVMLYI